MASRTLLIARFAVLGSACGNDSRSPPDLGPDAALPCLPEDDGLGPEGQDIDLTIGVLEDGQFRELVDGDAVAATVGPQGFYMLVLELRGTLPISFDDACLRSRWQVDFETLDDKDRGQRVDFRRVEGNLFSGALPAVIGTKAETPPEEMAGVEIDLAITCADWGMSGAAALQQLSLFVVDPYADAGP